MSVNRAHGLIAGFRHFRLDCRSNVVKNFGELIGLAESRSLAELAFESDNREKAGGKISDPIAIFAEGEPNLIGDIGQLGKIGGPRDRARALPASFAVMNCGSVPQGWLEQKPVITSIRVLILKRREHPSCDPAAAE